MLAMQADTEAYFGHLHNSRDFSKRSVESATRANAQETAATWEADAALREAEFGSATDARQHALAALNMSQGRDVSCFAAVALARAGDQARADKLVESLTREYPSNTIVQRYWLPTIRAALALNAKQAPAAIDALKVSEPYESGQTQPLQLGLMYPVYLRGQAYLMERDGKQAAAEFQKIIDHRGIVLNSTLGSLAYLGIARAFALEGNTNQARAAYQHLLELWKDAEPDLG